MNESSLAQLLGSAHTAALALRVVGHGFHALGHRIQAIERQAADLRWRPIMARLAWNLCLRPARR